MADDMGQRCEKFVDYAIKRVREDNAFAAALKRADNPDTAYQAWEYLSSWCSIDNDKEIYPFSLVAAGIGRTKPDVNGNLGLGKAIACCYEDGKDSDAAKSKLRRLLACRTLKGAFPVLRHLLSLIASHGVSLNYARLLRELLFWGDGEYVKRGWAVDFYGGRKPDDSIDA